MMGKVRKKKVAGREVTKVVRFLTATFSSFKLGMIKKCSINKYDWSNDTLKTVIIPVIFVC